MRTSEIEVKTLELLYAGQYQEAIDSFKTTCEKYENCAKSSECTARCLIPKLRYLSLSQEENILEIIISDLQDSLLIGDFERS